jgi:hypothetical protein
MSTDIGDSITVDCHITDVRRFAGAIEYKAVANDQFVVLAGGIDGSRG